MVGTTVGLGRKEPNPVCLSPHTGSSLPSCSGEKILTILKGRLKEGGMDFVISFPLNCCGGVGDFSLDMVSIIEIFSASLYWF